MVVKTLRPMSGNRFLLDTNIVIAFFNEEKSVTDHIKSDIDICIPAPALGELYFGAEKSGQKKANIEKINQLAEVTTVLFCDAQTAKFYGRIKNELKFKGTPIPENDIWIAALSEQYQLAG